MRARRIARTAAGLLTAFVLYFGLTSWWILDTWKTSEGASSDCIIILGAAVWNGKPSPALRERLEVALDAWKQGLAPNIIASGGRTGEKLSEAEAMKLWLVEHGVPERSILEENESTSTQENLTNSRELMKQQGWTDAVLVTHGYHALRSSLMAKSLGIPVTVEPVQVRPLNLAYATIRECAGIAYFAAQLAVQKAAGLFR